MPYIGNSPANNVRGRFYYTATAAQTVFSGADSNGKTLAYQDGGYVDVYLNGVLLQDTTDYTATTKTSVTLTSGATAGDLVEIIAYGIFSVGDTVSAANGGTFKGNINVVGTVTSDGLTVDGNSSITGDLTVDTDTLYVDSTNNRVGIGTSSPTSKLQIRQGNNSNTAGIRVDENTAGNVYGALSASGTNTISLTAGSASSDSTTLRFLTASSGTEAEAMRIDSSGNVGIGSVPEAWHSAFNGVLQVGTYGVMAGTAGSAQFGSNFYYDGAYKRINNNYASRTYQENGNHVFETAATGAADSAISFSETMRIDSSGNLLVHKTSPDQAVEGMEFASGNYLLCTKSGGTTAYFNRTSSDGSIAEFRKDGTTVGSLGTQGTYLHIEGSTSGAYGLKFVGSSYIRPSKNNGLTSDNELDLGTPTARFDDIYATNGTIQTSDRNEKQQIASLTDAEITAAKAISKLFKTFKWNDKVAEKGDAARTHAGVIAQDVQQAMIDAGLDAGNYAFFISSTWWEADETYTDDDGVEQTRTNSYATAEEAPDNAVERTRLGIRYPELLAFIGAATEQRLTSIEARLDALETP
jgi:hypothetical protein